MNEVMPQQKLETCNADFRVNAVNRNLMSLNKETILKDNGKEKVLEARIRATIVM